MEELYDKESTTLLLRATTGITSTSKVLTWNNVNMNMALGTMYNKYNTFNLILKTVIMPAGASLTSTSNLILSYYLTGLNVKNGTYDYSFGGQTSRAYIGSSMLGSTLATAANASITYTSLIPVTFTKAELANLSIYIRNIDGNEITSGAAVNDTLPSGITFVFQIVGVS